MRRPARLSIQGVRCQGIVSVTIAAARVRVELHHVAEQAHALIEKGCNLPDLAEGSRLGGRFDVALWTSLMDGRYERALLSPGTLAPDTNANFPLANGHADEQCQRERAVTLDPVNDSYTIWGGILFQPSLS